LWRRSPEQALDERPALRIAALFGVILLAVCAIAARVTFVETQLAETIANEFNRQTERWEPIPSHDGRIIAADGEASVRRGSRRVVSGKEVCMLCGARPGIE